MAKFPEDAPLADTVFRRTYSRTKPDGSSESWDDCVQRVVDGNLSLVDQQFIEAGERERLLELIGSTQMLPAGRHLWVSGVQDRAFVANCHVAGFEKGLGSHLAFTFSELMKGGGVGANYSSYLTSKLKPLLHRVALRFECSPDHPDYESIKHLLGGPSLDDPHMNYYFTIPDSREGWVDALRLLIGWSEASPITLVFDVSKIRCAGSPIKGFGGTAAGPICLMDMLYSVQKIIASCGGDRPNPLQLMELDHAVASCVIAGNVRRSARMSIVRWNDRYIHEFLACKEDTSKHWSTNISVEVDDEFFEALAQRRSQAVEVFNTIVTGMLRDGEPGFYNSSLASVGERGHMAATNPCGEMPLSPWENCTLGHVNLGTGDAAAIRESFRLMARFLIRATFADFEDPKQRTAVNENRRIGVGFLGLQEWLARHRIKMSQADYDPLLKVYLKEWRSIVQHTARIYSLQLGIPTPIKTTTVAPTGSIAHLAGTSCGMEPIKARYFIRRVRYATTDPEVARLKEQGVTFEEDIYTPHTLVACIPCADPLVDRVGPELIEEASDISPAVLMDLQVLIQHWYADNAVSHTISVEPGRWTTEEFGALLRPRLARLKGITVFPDMSRPQQPITRITEEEYLSMTRVDVPTMDESELQCAGGACPIR